MCEKEGSEHVDRVLPGEELGRDRSVGGIVQSTIASNTGIVDEDVDLKLALRSELLVRCGKNGCYCIFGFA